MTTRVWALRADGEGEVLRAEFINACIGYLYRTDRPAHKAMRRAIAENDYAEFFRAGRYTIAREDAPDPELDAVRLELMKQPHPLPHPLPEGFL